MDKASPLCFGTKDNFEAWVSLAEKDCIDDNPRLSFCAFCTRSYQAIMTKVGKCQNPDTRIYEEENGTEEFLITEAKE